MLKHILTPATGTASDAAVFETALAVSRRFEAHLEFLHARPDPAAAIASMAGADPGGGFAVGQLMETIEQEGRKGERRARAAWSTFCAAERLPTDGTDGLSAELVVAVGDEATLLVQHGRTADLLVIGRRHGNEKVAMDLLQDVLCGTGRPLLIAAPRHAGSLFDTVVIAWKDTAEAGRAVSAAAPFIEAAAAVLVLTVDEDAAHDGAGGPETGTSCDRLVATLRRHNAHVSAQHLTSGGSKPVDVLLHAAVAAKAGLLVMGGYGHSRMRETVFGGFTQHVLRGCAIPVLLTH